MIDFESLNEKKIFIMFASLRRSVQQVSGPISAAQRLDDTAPKKRRSSGKLLVTLCPILSTQDSNPRSPAPIAIY